MDPVVLELTIARFQQSNILNADIDERGELLLGYSQSLATMADEVGQSVIRFFEHAVEFSSGRWCSLTGRAGREGGKPAGGPK
jgi:hypothetical protein